MGCGASRTIADQQTPATELASAGSTATVAIESPPGSKLPSKAKLPEPDLPGTAVVKAWVAGADGTLCFPEVDDPDFAIPALETEKLPLAICISGGGFRAATLGLGWLRALHLQGVLSKAQYLCTCSGASWLSAALSFQRLVPLDEFLGPYLPPEECGLQAIGQVGERGRAAAAVLADAEPLRQLFKGLPRGLAERGDNLAQQARSWTKAIAGAFLESFGLGDTDLSTVTVAGTKSGMEAWVRERAAAVDRGNVFTADLGALPFPIIVQVIMLPTDRLKFYPLEWTPLYSGCPVRLSETSPKLGAGWVETMGLNADLVGQPEPIPGPNGGGSDGGVSAVHVRVRPVGPASLGEATGISSSYMASKWTLGKGRAGRAVFKALGFNTAQYFDQQDWTSSHVQLADGSAVDYFALHPALRRRVPFVIVCSASRTAIENPKFASYMQDLAGLFGCWPGRAKPDKDKDKEELTVEEYNKRQQVFACEGFTRLMQALQATSQAGQAPVHVDEYEVLDNAALGIRGGWRVRIMWVVNAQQPAWEAALPADTRERLLADRITLRAKMEEALNPLDADTLREFPHVSTFAMNYTPQLVQLMAQHAAHMLMSSAAEVQGMVAAAERARERQPQGQRQDEGEACGAGAEA